VISGLDPQVNRKDIQAINELVVSEISRLGRKTGLTLKQAQALKQSFDTLSKDTYAQGGKIFANSAGVKRAAKAAADDLRKAIADMSPEIASANKQLTRLRTIEKTINKNLIGEGKSDAALFAVGNDLNKRNSALLRRLGEITGTKPVEKAQVIAAAKAFAEPPLTAADVTGKGVERLAKGAILGAAVGGPTGAFIGGIATSPAALKAAIRTGQVTPKLAKQVFEKATPSVKSILIQQFGKANFPENAVDRRSRSK
jgi:hypothetical protein